MARSRWRTESDRVIRQVLESLPRDATEQDARRALRDAYPWHPREGHPYKVWLSAVRENLKRHFAARERPHGMTPYFRLAPGLRNLGWLTVACGWCDARPGGCVVCRLAYARLNLILADPEFQRLQAGSDGEAGLLVLRDWLLDQGLQVVLGAGPAEGGGP